jgi:hypothetical protein
MYGSEPIKEKKIQENVTIILASFFVNDSVFEFLFLKTNKNKPRNNAIKPDVTNGLTGSENKIAIKALTNKKPVKMNKLLPTTGKFKPRLNILPIHIINCSRKIDGYFIKRILRFAGMV